MSELELKNNQDPNLKKQVSIYDKTTYTISRDDIFDLGFLRSDPQRLLYKHKDKKDLYLLESFPYNFSIYNFIDYRIEIYKHDGSSPILIYESNKPTKEEIQEVLDKYE